LATVLSLLYRVIGLSGLPISPFFPTSTLLELLIILNVRLAIFNLVPIHPLDGGKILVGLLPRPEAHKVDLFLHQYGLIMLLVLVFPIFGGTAPILALINPIVNILLSIYLPVRPIV
jgi:Zn-dependent protease